MIIEKETYKNTKRKNRRTSIKFYTYILHYYLYLTAFVCWCSFCIYLFYC